MMTNYYHRNQKAGVALLFAILLVSVILTVSLTLLNITFRQLILSSLARESQFAFYAADSARNCARYYDNLDDPDDRPFGYFQLVSSNLTYTAAAHPVTPVCGTELLAHPNMTIGSDLASATWVIRFSDGSKNTCAYFTITKGMTGNGGLSKGKTKIEAYGYNNYQNGATTNPCYIPSDRTVERAATMIY